MEYEKNWFKAYLFAWFINSIGGSIYYTFSRPYLREMLGKESFMVVGYLLAAEQVPAILSIMTGFLADRIGRRKLFLIGFLNAPLYALLGVINPFHLPIIITLIGIIRSLSGPAILGTILHATGRSGKAYSYIAMVAAIGWVIGGILPGLLIDIVKPIGLFTLTGFMGTLAILIQYIYYPHRVDDTDNKIGLNELGRAIAATKELILVIILSNAALNLYYNMVSLKVYSEIKNLLLYGIIFSTSTALANAIVRPYSGKLVDKYDPINILLVSLIAYLFLNTGIYLSTGLILFILYAIPIYPFRDTAITISISRKTPLKLQATAAGIMAASTSISGILVFFLTSMAGKDFATVYMFHLFLVLSSIIIILMYKRRNKTCNIDVE